MLCLDVRVSWIIKCLEDPRHTIVGGANPTGGDDEIVIVHHASARFNAGDSDMGWRLWQNGWVNVHFLFVISNDLYPLSGGGRGLEFNGMTQRWIG